MRNKLYLDLILDCDKYYGKRYTNTVATGAKKSGSISMNTAWTTVISKSSNRAIIAVSP
ncbi:16171_t:CDS:2 [Funneliformis geosporum]|nr:16171_t:CDS:2 [Funneliformis geosporum]